VELVTPLIGFLAVLMLLRGSRSSGSRPSPAEQAANSARNARHWFLLMAILTPPWLGFCYWVYSLPDNNATSGLSGFLGMALALPCVVAFLVSSLVYSLASKASRQAGV
jgi:hypothetical protein